MRVIAVHDEAGKIYATMSISQGGPSGGMRIFDAQRVSEFEVPEISHELNVQEIHARLVEIAKNSQVEVKVPEVKLITKEIVSQD